MITTMLSKFKVITDILAFVDEKLGFKKFIQYILVILGLYVAFNFKNFVRDVIEISNEIYEEQHAQKMLLRDELLIELNPILTEMRAEMGADRILYLEYHNSKENLVGIPFKYIDLVLAVHKYGIPDFDYGKYREITAGVVTPLYQDLRNDKIIINSGIDNDKFIRSYSGISDFVIDNDASKQHCFLNLPGINTPIGMLIVEWMEPKDRDWLEIKEISSGYIARINALVLSKAGRGAVERD